MVSCCRCSLVAVTVKLPSTSYCQHYGHRVTVVAWSVLYSIQTDNICC